jgi:hypothetical protein
VAAELARRAIEPPEPFSDGSPDALACGLYHQSIVWGLMALVTAQQATSLEAAPHPEQPAADDEADLKSDDTDEADEDEAYEDEADDDADEVSDKAKPVASVAQKPSSTDRPEKLDSLSALWDAANPDKMLNEANVHKEDIEASKRKLESSSFESYADLPPDEQLAWSRRLRVVAEGLIYGIEISSGRYNPPWLARTLKLGLIFVLLCGLAWGGFSVKEYVVELDNVARGKPWVASSTYPAGCRSPQQSCMESPNFFFHTNDEANPWLEIDLGAVYNIKSVKVRNREDCCTDRTIPLLIEVSADGKQWQQVARKNEVFGEWHPEFAPTKVRWVRLRVAKKSILHLASVDVYK